MSLRLRLFVLLGSLVAALVLAEIWLVDRLARDVSGEVGHVAFRVGESVVASLAPRSPDGPRTQAPPAAWMERAPAPEGALPAPAEGSVTEREIRIREANGRLEIVDERLRMGFTATGGGEVLGDVAIARHPQPEGAASEGPAAHGPALPRTLVLSVASPPDARFLMLQGPDLAERIPIPRTGIEDTLARFRERLLLGSLAILALGLVAVGAIAHRASAPLRELASAARAVGEGSLGALVPHRGSGEVGEAIAAFNLMSRRLADLDADARRLRAQEHLREIGEIARGLAHGLRNPLNALGLSVDELAGASPERAEIAASARRQIRRIDQSVRSFLALASSGASAAETDVDVVALAQDVALEILQDGRGRNPVGVEVRGDVPPVRGVAAELRAVIQALVVNAVEASPEGARVVVRASPTEDGGVRVEVEDEGPGVAPEVAERLFTPHVTTKATGAGMGLYLAQRIVSTRHGGSLSLEPRAPRGTRAVVELSPTRSESARGGDERRG